MPDGNDNRRLRRSVEFATTHWTIVLSAAQDNEPGSKDAWEHLACAYWYPLYAFLRRSGHGAEDAADLTQSFFAHLLEKKVLKRLRADGGLFRSFLLTCLRHFAASQARREHAKRRSPEKGIVSFDAYQAEDRYQIEPVDGVSPEMIYEKRWARSILDRSLERLEAFYHATGKGVLFAKLKPHLDKDSRTVPYAELVRELQLSKRAVESQMYRLRKRFRLFFREAVAATVEATELEAEMRRLIRCLSG